MIEQMLSLLFKEALKNKIIKIQECSLRSGEISKLRHKRTHTHSSCVVKNKVIVRKKSFLCSAVKKSEPCVVLDL